MVLFAPSVYHPFRFSGGRYALFPFPQAQPLFRRLYRSGKNAANRYLVLYCRGNGSKGNRIGITVNAKLAHAVIATASGGSCGKSTGCMSRSSSPATTLSWWCARARSARRMGSWRRHISRWPRSSGLLREDV